MTEAGGAEALARKQVLDALCAWVDQAAFDPAQTCRRAQRLSVTRFIDVLGGVSPANEGRAAAFLERAAD